MSVIEERRSNLEKKRTKRENDVAEIKRLKTKGFSNVTIAKTLELSESIVRHIWRLNED